MYFSTEKCMFNYRQESNDRQPIPKLKLMSRQLIYFSWLKRYSKNTIVHSKQIVYELKQQHETCFVWKHTKIIYGQHWSDCTRCPDQSWSASMQRPGYNHFKNIFSIMIFWTLALISLIWRLNRLLIFHLNTILRF